MSWAWINFLLIVLIVCISLIIYNILNMIGVFRKERPCMYCGTAVKGTKQVCLGINNSEQDVLCHSCFNKVHPRLRKYAEEYWNYSDYTKYLAWEEDTYEERARFKPMIEYGVLEKLKIDMDNGLFSLGSNKNEMVFRFVDLADADMDFEPEVVKDKFLGLKVEGYEYVAVRMRIPFTYIEEKLNDVSYAAREKGLINKHCEYEISEEFSRIMRIFSTCVYAAECINNSKEEQYSYNSEGGVSVSEIEKALALFMFDSVEDVTKENLRKQRNMLIRAFHPDNNEKNEEYSKKINAAYELLGEML